MTLKLETPVSMLYAVVVDPTHPRFGQTADVTACDWRYSKIFASFTDGEYAELNDSWMQFDPPPQAILMKRDDPKLQRLLARLPGIKAELYRLWMMAHAASINSEKWRVAKLDFASLLTVQS